MTDAALGATVARRSGPPARELLAAFPDTDPAELLTLPGLLRAAVRRHGERIAVVEGDRTTTYDELWAATADVRDLLADRGIGPGARVGLRIDNGVDFVTSLFAIARTGAVAVLLNTLWTRAELDAAIATCAAVCILTTPAEPGGPPTATDVRRLAGPPTGAVGKDASLTPDDDAVVLFTSGSTGTPKAVLHRHRAPALQSLRWSGLHGMGPGDVLLSTSPYFWSSGLAKSMGAGLVSGSTVVAMPRFSARAALRIIEQRRVTHLISPLHLDHQIMQDPTFAERDLSSLRAVHRRSPLKEALGLRADWNPGGYGLSEMFTLVSSYRADTDPDDLAGSEGWVLPGVDVKIVDPYTGEPVAVGCTGRICVRGDTLMRKYEGLPAGDVPFDDEGYFPTSDVGELDAQGRLFFRGRTDSIVRSGGTNLSPAEIENALQGWHRVRRCAAVAVPHPTRGSALVLCVVPADDDLTTHAVLAHLRDRLAGFKLPRRTVFVRADEVRYTPTAKVDLAHARTLVMTYLVADDVEPEWRQLLLEELACAARH